MAPAHCQRRDVHSRGGKLHAEELARVIAQVLLKAQAGETSADS
ncbi:hypothetical protein [Ktedonobacter racemifer]|nr:hypothetical protein [Ktedonobacter racemifer]